MSTTTRKVPTEVTETVVTCDICGEEITDSSRKCLMCGRDVHNARYGSCSVYDEEEEHTICMVCHKLNGDYKRVVERCGEQVEAARDKWKDDCQDHRYDEREGGA